MSIHQQIEFQCTPETLFRALTTSSEFSAATGAPAEIDAVEGGAFSAFGGQITGHTIELSDNETLVQEWRVAAWPEGVASTVRFDLQASATGTTLTLEQSGYPDDAEQHLDGGWHKMYWEPLKKHCE